MRFDTKLVRAGQEPEPGTGDLVPAIHLSTGYDRRWQDPPRYFYGRGENPTREGLERCLAALEDARFATTFASGQAAAATVCSLVPPGHSVLCTDDVYPGTDALLALLTRQGSRLRYADLSDPDQLTDALATTPDLSLVWIESPTNPLLKVVDIAAVRRQLVGREVLVVVDNTFAGPVFQQPLALGTDLSLYSTTKSIAGHGDVLGGALVYQDSELHGRIREYRTAAGNVPGALDCFLIHRGLKTLSLRAARQNENALALVELLSSSAAVGLVRYPGLKIHPQYAVAARQMAQPGSMVSFEYLGDPERLLNRLELFGCSVSLGGVASLIECPALMSHRGLPAEVLARRGITRSLIRLSAGIEDPHDLVEDLKAGLGR
ncbi:MAG TPA: PLP-dependent aspartate aminotransferase family protein [Jatrophihabitans sp.]|nr:PLP-dependent aspartate aminotransferase family protein [Jatrophihabitans sp.]